MAGDGVYKRMEDNPVIKLVEQQNWLTPVGEKSDAALEGALGSGGAAEAAKDVLVNSRLLGHKKHPTITDVPLGSWTVTLVSDVLETAGNKPCAAAGDVSITVGLVASGLAALGGLADLSRTSGQSDRRVGMMHGILHGVTMLLYSASLLSRRRENRMLGRAFSVAGYGTLLAASYLANELAERQAPLVTAQGG